MVLCLAAGLSSSVHFEYRFADLADENLLVLECIDEDTGEVRADALIEFYRPSPPPHRLLADDDATVAPSAAAVVVTTDGAPSDVLVSESTGPLWRVTPRNEALLRCISNNSITKTREVSNLVAIAGK